MLAIASLHVDENEAHDWVVECWDVSLAFGHATLKELVYIRPPIGTLEAPQSKLRMRLNLLKRRLGLLDSQSRVPRQSLNSQRVPEELGLLGAEQTACTVPLKLGF